MRHFAPRCTCLQHFYKRPFQILLFFFFHFPIYHLNGLSHIPLSVAKIESQSEWLNSHFPSRKAGKFLFLNLQGSMSVFPCLAWISVLQLCSVKWLDSLRRKRQLVRLTYLWIDSGHLCQSSRWPSFASLFTSLSLTRRLGRVLRAPCCAVLSTKHPIFSNCRSHVECGRGSDIANTYVIIERAQIMNNCCPYCKYLKVVTFQ